MTIKNKEVITLKACAPVPFVELEQYVKMEKEEMGTVEHTGTATLYSVEIPRYTYAVVIEPGAFAESIQIPGDVKILWHHYRDTPIGKVIRFRDGLEKLEMDFEISLDVEQGYEAQMLLKQNIIAGLSVGFRYSKDDTVVESREYPQLDLVTIKKAELEEVSLLAFPAHGKDSVVTQEALSNSLSLGADEEEEMLLRLSIARASSQAALNRSQTKFS